MGPSACKLRLTDGSYGTEGTAPMIFVHNVCPYVAPFIILSVPQILPSLISTSNLPVVSRECRNESAYCSRPCTILHNTIVELLFHSFILCYPDVVVALHKRTQIQAHPPKKILRNPQDKPRTPAPPRPTASCGVDPAATAARMARSAAANA